MAYDKNSPTGSGRAQEDFALAYLAARGATPLERNFSCRGGEIDLVMREGGYLVFVEVRFRRTSHFGKPVETVGALKRARLVRAARYFLLSNPSLAALPSRFDVVGVEPAAGAGGFRVEWVRDAFRTDF